MSTYQAKPADIQKQWFVIDAEDLVVGRLAAVIATYLRGKHKPTYTPNQDCGDNIIVINAEKLAFTGRKWSDKTYYWHTGYPGGIKERKAFQIRDGKFPERVLEKAVQRMMPRGPLARQQLKNLRIYGGAEHKHDAQNPVILDIAEKNTKNKRAA